MEIITVYPLAKGIRSQTLDYFYPEPINRGRIVTIPIGNRTEKAVVADSSRASQKKAALRSAEYQLKRIESVGKQIFLAQFLAATEEFARFSGVTAGAALRALLPRPVLANNTQLPGVSYDMFLPSTVAPTPELIQNRPQKQAQYLRSLVQSHVSSGESVFICNPTLQKADQTRKQLRTDPVVLTSELTKTQMLARWREAAEAREPQVIVGTPTFLALPRPDLGRIIIREESDASYKMQSRPFLDKSLFARQLAKSLKRRAALADSVPSINTQWEYKNGDITAAFSPNTRRTDKLKTQLIDMKELPADADSGVQVFSPPTAQMIRRVQKNGGRLLLFVARRGRRPFTICNDCGQILECGQCGMPLVLVDEDSERRYVCRTCGSTETSHRRCDNCNSWRLKPLGIGIDFVADILQEQLPDVDVFPIDSDTKPDKEAVDEAVAEFRASESGILLTTKLGINHLTESVENSAVVTADSLLAIPDLSVSHELFKMLMTIRDYTQKQFVIQTRSKETSLLEQALAGNISGFYDEQIDRRKDFAYPPFSYLIKLTISGNKKQVQELTGQIKERLSNWKTQSYPAKTEPEMNILIRVDKDQWVDEKLLGLLRQLPPAVSVNAHPRSLL